jgi:circadian clock protein KaiC
MAHSNQVRELLLDDQGIHLADVFRGAGEFRTGSARIAQQGRDQTEAIALQRDRDRQRRLLELRRRDLAAQIQALEAQLAAVEEDAGSAATEESQQIAASAHEMAEISRVRGAD